MAGLLQHIEAIESLGLEKPLIDGDTGTYDVAEWNLACAQGLPGSETIDLPTILDSLDEMARHVEREIERNYHHFLREPKRYGNSQAQWCALMLITVLQQDFGVRYNMQRARDPDFRNSADLFIHGMLGGEGGTCSSMPVLYTAIGRRLSWPIKLALARAHVFCRWDDPEGQSLFGPERFNIEGSSLGGHIYDDEFYHTWPEPIPDDDVAQGVYLKSLTPEEELASFLSLRGHCLFDNRQIADARDIYRWCRLLAPNDPHYEAFHVHTGQVRDRLIEKETLEKYFGPGVPLPFGAFPRHVLRKMASDMLLAEHDHREAERRAQEERLHQQRERQRLGAMPRRMGANETVCRVEHRPNSQIVDVPHSGGGVALPNSRNRPAMPGIPQARQSGDEGRFLPARLLRECHPQALMHRRQEALALLKEMPPGTVIEQPLRISLKPPNRRPASLKNQTNGQGG